MGQRKNRQAQVWAVQLASGISRAVLEGRILLPSPLPNIGLLGKGKALRFCQETNYAKKQEEAKGANPAGWALKAIPVGEEFQLTIVKPSGRMREINEGLYTTVAGIVDSLEANPAGQPALAPQGDTPASQLAQEQVLAKGLDAQDELLRQAYGVD